MTTDNTAVGGIYFIARSRLEANGNITDFFDPVTEGEFYGTLYHYDPLFWECSI